METITSDKPREKLLSFDVVSSVNALKFDLDSYGCVLSETRQQVLNQELSYITEGIDKSARTTFIFKRRGDDLVYFDDGRWRQYDDMLETGRQAAIYDAAIDPRRQFLVNWANNDILQHEQNKHLRPGESRAWTSPYPADMELRYGVQFMSDCGLVPKRRMGYLYRAECKDDGSVVLESQTIDRSDDDAFAEVLGASAANPKLDLDQLTAVYDQTMSDKYGGHFYAGRRDSERQQNAWKEVLANQDLVNYLYNGLVMLATKSIDLVTLEKETKQHIYGVWALFSKRLAGLARPVAEAVDPIGYISNHIWLRHEVENALKEFVSEGRVMIGCGGSISILKGEGQAIEANGGDVLSAIFGSKNKTEVMKCVHCPLCNRQGVDAVIEYKDGKKTITCSKCKKSKTY